ncbi:MAG: alpha/beta hydrolase [Stackebrandtia sp.]
MRKRKLGIAAVVLAGGVAVTAFAVSPAIAEPKADIDWKPCEDVDDKAVTCATIEVPLDYSDPDGETIEIGLARREATNPDERIGTILADPGGPGGSGVEMVQAGTPLTPAVSERFDVVGFDPRGINTSTQIVCDEELAAQAEELKTPTSAEEFDELAKVNGDLAADCRERTGELYDHVDNLHTAQDMDAIREALGEEKLNYLGYSYGSLMGQQYAEMFPDRIRAMVNDGNMDHSLESTWDFVSTETAPVEASFENFADWCEGEEKCALNGQDVREAYAGLRDAAEAGELVDPETGDPIGFYDLSSTTFGGVTHPSGWSDLAEQYAALIEGRASDADVDAVKGAETNFVLQGVWCQDWGYEVADYDEWESMMSQLSEEYPNVQWSPYVSHALTCVGYPGETTNPRAPLEIEDAPPLVMLGNVYDPATVYAWNEVAAEQSGSDLITYEGYGHTIYGRDSDCVNDLVDAYFLELKAPGNTSCPGVEEPGSDAGADSVTSPNGPVPYAKS